MTPATSKPPLRQPPTPSDRAPSWWITHPTREGFTEAGAKATESTRHRREVTGIGLGSLLRGE